MQIRMIKKLLLVLLICLTLSSIVLASFGESKAEKPKVLYVEVIIHTSDDLPFKLPSPVAAPPSENDGIVEVQSDKRIINVIQSFRDKNGNKIKFDKNGTIIVKYINTHTGGSEYSFSKDFYIKKLPFKVYKFKERIMPYEYTLEYEVGIFNSYQNLDINITSLDDEGTVTFTINGDCNRVINLGIGKEEIINFSEREIKLENVIKLSSQNKYVKKMKVKSSITLVNHGFYWLDEGDN
ncbi:MAG TPA: hypothetical protein PLZ08_10845 [Bacillota bacterium]|nr:hypothetical protein [Bacillota bacterium]HOL10630.1 hypothetical protein [Bacillota bacterium]HPO98435.1 hypothetical protein [Bacillota bacterium]